MSDERHIVIRVPGRAQPAGSKRALWKKGMAYARVVDDNPNSRAWKERVALAAQPGMEGLELFDCPLRLEVCFLFTRPRGHFRAGGQLSKTGRETPHPIGRPDATKLVRAIEDALQGVVYVDDARICDQRIVKRWGDRDETVILIAPLAEATVTTPHFAPRL